MEPVQGRSDLFGIEGQLLPNLQRSALVIEAKDYDIHGIRTPEPRWWRGNRA
jgi:hypothetical protein